jgi:thiamine transporter
MNIRQTSTVAAGAALAVVLGIVCKAVLPGLPYGGSVSLEPLPILLIGIWRGGRAGVATGVLTGLLQLIVDPHVYHPVQVLLDYPVAFALLGLAGVLPGPRPVGIVAANALRFASHFASGIVFFGAYAPEGTSVWAYSAAYNALYVVPETLLALVLIPLLLRRLSPA